MAGDEDKRSKAGAELDSDPVVSDPVVSDQVIPIRVVPAYAGPAGTAPASDSPDDADARTASDIEAAAPLDPEVDAESEAASTGPEADGEPRIAPPTDDEAAPAFGKDTEPEPIPSLVAASPDSAATRRGGFLPRAMGYATLVGIGALVSIGGAFILHAIQGSSSAPVDMETDQRIAALHARTDALERKHEAASAAVSAFHERLGAAEANVREAMATAHSAARGSEKALAARTPAEAPASGAPPAEAPDLDPLLQRLEVIEQRLGEQRAAAGAGAIDTATEGRETDGKATSGTSDIPRVQAIAIVAGRLLQEIERGDAFAHEVTTLTNLGVSGALLAPLRAGAESGVASLHQLAEQFTRLAPSVLATVHTEGDETLVERLKDFASNLVHIERPDDIDAKDVRGLVARIKYALAHDHVADAYAFWTELPDPAKAKSEAFGAAAKDRLDVINAARSIEADAVAALSKPKS